MKKNICSVTGKPLSIIGSNTESTFKLVNGAEVANALELADALLLMSDDTFYYHVNEHKNDFGTWIKDVFRDHELADAITRNQDRVGTANAILRNLVSSMIHAYDCKV